MNNRTGTKDDVTLEALWRMVNDLAGKVRRGSHTTYAGGGNVTIDANGISLGQGAVILDRDGILFHDSGDALVFFDAAYNQYGVISLRPWGSSNQSVLSLRNYKVTDEDNQISNGDFATGSFSSWTETDTGSYVNVSTVEDGSHAARFTGTASDYLTQSFSALANGAVVTFRARGILTGTAGDTFYPTLYIGPAASWQNMKLPTDSTWRNVTMLFTGSVSDIKVSGVGTGSNTIEITDIVVRPTGTTTAYINLLQAGLYLGGPLVVNDEGADVDTRIEGDTDANLVHVDAGTDRVGIGTATPGYKLDVNGNVNATGFKVNGSVLILPESNSEAIFRCDTPGGASVWTGTINGTPSGSTLVYTTSSGNAGAMKPTATTQLAKMRLYNTTRNAHLLISDCNTGTNTLTFTATVPGTWANGDVITIVSQTVSGGGVNWVDLEITSGPTNKSALYLFTTIVPSAAGEFLRTHPFETYGVGKIQSTTGQVATVIMNGLVLVAVTSNVFSCAWSGSPSVVQFREAGYLG